MKIRLAFLVAFVVGAAGMRGLRRTTRLRRSTTPPRLSASQCTLSKCRVGQFRTPTSISTSKSRTAAWLRWGCEGAVSGTALAPVVHSAETFKLGDTMTVDATAARRLTPDGRQACDARRRPHRPRVFPWHGRSA
jgi:hypothetical protein